MSKNYSLKIKKNKDSDNKNKSKYKKNDWNIWSKLM